MDKATILNAAYELASRHGVHNVMKRHIAKHLKCGMGTVNYHWSRMTTLRKAVLAQAKADGRLLEILAGK